MADTGYRPQQPSWIRQLLTKIRLFLRKIGWSHHELTDQDILNVIAIASKESRKRKRGRNGNTRFSIMGEEGAIYGAKKNKAYIKTFFNISNIEEYINTKGVRAVAVAKSAEQSNNRPDAKPALIDTARIDNNIPQNPENASGENGVRHSIAPDVGSAAFKNWFADSKVVDQNGEPLVVYHGSSAVFYAFDPKKIKSGAFGKGIYLSPSKANARAYGSNVMALYAKIAKPYIIKESLGFTAGDFKSIQQETGSVNPPLLYCNAIRRRYLRCRDDCPRKKKRSNCLLYAGGARPRYSKNKPGN